MSASSKRVCYRGHDTAVVGRSKSHGCKACHRDDVEAVKALRVKLPRDTNTSGIRLDFAPVEQLIRDRGLHAGNLFNTTCMRRWRAQGIPLMTADEIAVRVFRMHPVQIWGSDWDPAEESA